MTGNCWRANGALWQHPFFGGIDAVILTPSRVVHLPFSGRVIILDPE